MAAMDSSMDAAKAKKASLQEQIRTQGEVVRQMKKDKKPKEEVRAIFKVQGSFPMAVY